MKNNRRFLVTLSAPLATLILAPAVYAGTTAYDMSRLIDEPHPFAATASAQVPPPIVTLQQTGPATISSPGTATGVVRQGQPYAIGSSNRGAFEQPAARSNSGVSTVPRALPPPLAFPMPKSIPASKSAQPSSIIRAPAKQPPVQVSQVNLRSDNHSLLTFGVGYYDINDNQDAVEFRAEWRFKRLFWRIHPFVGLMGTSDSAVYGYAGLALDWFLGKSWVITPSFAAGAYRDGDGKDLGHAVEFRSMLEVAYRFQNNHRLGLSIYHLSNASLGDSNPGTEVLSLGYSIPFD